MKVKLVSDFRDIYDHWFDLEGEPFERISTGGMSRPEMLAYLDGKGVPTVWHGWVKDQMHLLGRQTLQLGTRTHTYTGQDERKVVVYTDLQAHRGEGKLLMTLAEAARDYPDAYCSFYQDTDMVGYSERYLQIGARGFKIGYQSTDDWRSNCGNVTITPARRFPPHYEERVIAQEYPLFAIDYVKRQRGGMEPTSMPFWVAVDFNIAPGLKGTGIEDLLDSTEVVDLIREAMEKR